MLPYQAFVAFRAGPHVSPAAPPAAAAGQSRRGAPVAAEWRESAVDVGPAAAGGFTGATSAAAAALVVAVAVALRRRAGAASGAAGGRRRGWGSIVRAATKGDLDKASAITSKIDSRLAELTDKIASQLDVRTTVEQKAAQLQSKLQAELDVERKITSELTERIDTLQKAYSSLSDTLEFQQVEAQERVDSMQRTVNMANREAEDAKKANQDYLKRLQQAEEDERQLQEELARVEMELKAAEEKAAKQAKKEKELQAELESKDKKIQQADVQLGKAKIVEAELRKAKSYYENQNKELFQRIADLQVKEGQMGEMSDLLRKTEDKLKLSARKEQDLLDTLEAQAEEALKAKGELANAELREAELRKVREYFEKQNKELLEQVTKLQGKDVEAKELSKLLQSAENKVKTASVKQQDLLDDLANKDQELQTLKGQLKNAALREGEYKKAKAYFETQNRELMSELAEAHEMNKGLEDKLMATEERLEKLLAKFM